MVKSKDTRDYSRAGPPNTGALAGFAAAVTYTLAGAHEVSVERVNAWTGTPDLLRSSKATANVDASLIQGREAGSTTERREAAALLIDQALEHVKAVAPALGFAGAELPELVPDPHVEILSGGAGFAVHLSQYYRGIPLFQMTRTVRFDGSGAVQAVAGMTVPLLNNLPTTPMLEVRVAAMAAARYIESDDDEEPQIDPFTQQPLDTPKIDASRFAPTIIAAFPFPSQPTVLERGPFEENILAHLVLFYTAPKPNGQSTRLGWHFKFTLPGYHTQYSVIVAADSDRKDPEILYCQPTAFAFATKGTGKPGKGNRTGTGSGRRSKASTKPAVVEESAAKRGSATEEALGDLVSSGKPSKPTQPEETGRIRVRGTVWTHNPQQNANQRSMVDFPRPLGDYPLGPKPLPDPSFPREWCEVQTGATIGNCTVAVLGETTTSIMAQRDPTELRFEPADQFGDEQKVVNIFYFCNYMHDFFYLLGFDETSGNFQLVHYTQTGGTPGDPVLARAHPGQIWGTANMSTRADGVQPLMNMGSVEFTDSSGNPVVRHTALDSDVVFHEFVHGVTNRLVGGRLDGLGLQQPQSRGMGEGWSDYFALTVQSVDAPNIKEVTGDWVTGRPGGIRMYPYSPDYPGTFGQIGQTPYTAEHAIGEIWCATLIQMNRNLGQALGSAKRGHLVGWQIVVDGLKFTPANPSFLDARDAIVAALKAQKDSGNLTEDEFGHAWTAVWKAFIRFGMGPGASSVGASLQGIVEDKTSPVPAAP